MRRDSRSGPGGALTLGRKAPAPAVWLLLPALVWLTFGWTFIEDDAFIHLVFARNVAEGNGYSFNGLAVNADSSPAWVLFLAALMALGFASTAAAKLASAVGVLVAIGGVARTGRSFLVSRPGRVAWFLLALLHPFLWHFAYAGMESAMAFGLAAILLSACHSAVSQPGKGGMGRSALIAAAIAPLVRFEFLALALAALLLHARSARRPIFWFLVPIGLLPIATWLVFAKLQLGSVMPTTHLAKKALLEGPSAWLFVMTRAASVLGVGYGVTWLSLSAAWAFQRAQMRKVAFFSCEPGVVTLFCWAAAVFGFYLVNHTVVQTRYTLIAAPFVTLGLLRMLERLETPARRLRHSVLPGVIASLGTIAFIVVPHVRAKSVLVERKSAFFEEVARQLDSHEPVAIYSIGQAAHHLKVPIVDLGGIVMPDAIPSMLTPRTRPAWIASKGARCNIGRKALVPHAKVLASVRLPSVGWLFPPRKYTEEFTSFLFCSSAASTSLFEIGHAVPVEGDASSTAQESASCSRRRSRATADPVFPTKRSATLFRKLGENSLTSASRVFRPNLFWAAARCDATVTSLSPR